MKKSSPEANQKTGPSKFQRLSVAPKHQFRWSRGVATCSCGKWTLWGDSLEGARRSHAYHRRNRWELEPQIVGQMKPDADVSEPLEDREDQATSVT